MSRRLCACQRTSHPRLNSWPRAHNLAPRSTTTFHHRYSASKGRKSKRRPYVIRNDVFEGFLHAACKALQLAGGASGKHTIVYDIDGRRVLRVADIVPGALLLIASQGQVPIRLIRLIRFAVR